MQLHLTYVGRFEKTSKAGKPYTSMSLKANEYGDKYISGFGGKENAHWKAGDSIEVDVEQKGEYLNFSMPKKSEKFAPSGDLLRVETKVDPTLEGYRRMWSQLEDMRSVLGQILKKVDTGVDTEWDTETPSGL